MSVQRVPICFKCDTDVEHDPIFAAPCDHERCPSLVWHPLCLMEWREYRDKIKNEVRESFVMIFERWRQK